MAGLRPAPFGPGRAPGGEGRDLDLLKQGQERQGRGPHQLRERYYEDHFEAGSSKPLTQLQPGLRPEPRQALAALESAPERRHPDPAEVVYFPKDGPPVPKETDPWRMTRRPRGGGPEEPAPRPGQRGSYAGAAADGLQAQLRVHLSQRI